MELPPKWDALYRAINSLPSRFGTVGVRDPDNVCESYDGLGYNGRGHCMSDGHYMCTECSELSPKAPRFTNDEDGRRDRLILFFASLRKKYAHLSR